MTIKSLLLGAAAGIAAIGAAQAADLPMTKGEAVEYVKVCSAFGPGFFYIPGSDTCLQISGEIRADYAVYGGSFKSRETLDGVATTTPIYSGHSNLDWTRDSNRTLFQGRAQISFDARTQTEYGLLRSYFTINGNFGGPNGGSAVSVDKAYIQFGGLTAGYAHTFFGYYDNNYGDTLVSGAYYASNSTVDLLAYTAQFGGFTATLALENAPDHRNDFWSISGLAVAVPPAAAGPSPVFSNVKYGGQVVPDVVANLTYAGDWGAVTASGALHQDRVNEATHLNGVDDKWGWAVSGAVDLAIPGIDKGHWVTEATYASGATNYLGLTNSDLVIYTPDNVVFSTDRRHGWSIVSELGGNITPQLAGYVIGSYAKIEGDTSGLSTENHGWALSANLRYTVVKGFIAAAEVGYADSRSKISEALNAYQYKDKNSGWFGAIRLKRTF